MSDLRNAALVLRTLDLTAGQTSSVGELAADKTSMTWYNINLRTLLGDMYDDYDCFNLCLNTFITGFTANTVLTASDENKGTLINISGLPFINQTYNQASQHNTSKAVLGGVVWNTQVCNYINFYSNNIAMFGKNQDICNITISFTRISDGAQMAPSGVLPNQTFIFDIIGVKNDNIKAMKHLKLDKPFIH